MGRVLDRMELFSPFWGRLGRVSSLEEGQGRRESGSATLLHQIADRAGLSPAATPLALLKGGISGGLVFIPDLVKSPELLWLL